MSDDEGLREHTQHAMLIAWGEFARITGLLEGLGEIQLRQKSYHHTPQTKVVEFLVATLAGLEHLKEISRAAHPLDQDMAVAQAWGRTGWADASGVSRTLKVLSQDEAEQIIRTLQAISQEFINAEVNQALWQENRLVYDGDLTGLRVSKSSSTYPGVAYGHMDERICLGYQAAIVSMCGPTYGRMWLSVDHHSGNWVSAQSVEEMIQAAELRTGVRPWRRTELLEQRLKGVAAYGGALQQKLVERQQKVVQARVELEHLDRQLIDCQERVAVLEKEYQSKQRLVRPTSQLAQVLKKLSTFQKRRERRVQVLAKSQQLVEWTQGLLLQQQTEQSKLQMRLERFRQENSTNSQRIQVIFRLDAGFGTYENLALLIEMGYEIYTKLQGWKTLNNLINQVPKDAYWAGVRAQATMYGWQEYRLEGFYYPLDIGLERFIDRKRIKYCALLHFGATPVCQDLSAWHHFYNYRQTIEAGIKESKHIFHLHRLKVRSIPAIRLQENFVLFAANFIRWADVWLAQARHPNNIRIDHLGTKALVQVAAHTSADIVRNSNGKLLKFSKYSLFADQVLRLPPFALQLPLPLGKSYDFSSI